MRFARGLGVVHGCPRFLSPFSVERERKGMAMLRKHKPISTLFVRTQNILSMRNIIPPRNVKILTDKDPLLLLKLCAWPVFVLCE